MIYVHVPFCRSFCTYCDFYSETVCKGRGAEAVFGKYADELCAEIESRRSEIAATLGHNTLYIGGGTPSVLPLSVLERIVGALGYGPYEEFTLEVNPDDVLEKGSAWLEGLARLGVTRISMGVQSLDDGILRWMNRRHDADGAREAFKMLRQGPFDVSVDIITGVPGMSDTCLEATLKEIVDWRPDHISAYQLSIEEGSALAERIASGQETEAPEEQCRAQYEMVCRMLGVAGYEHYEISNWALPGKRSLHNSAYWTRKPFVGLGPGAHSLSLNPDCRSWNSQVQSGWTREGEKLTPEEIREETIMLGLRTKEGIDIDGRHVAIPESDWFVADDIISSMI